MNTKHYFTAILIFAAIVLSGFSVQAQNDADTIRIDGRRYYQKNIKLNIAQLVNISTVDKTAFRFIQKAQYQNFAACCFGIVGGGCLGFSLGYALGAAMFGNPMNKPLFFSLLGAGAVLTGIGIAFDVGANNKVKEGISIYNQFIKQRNSTNINLGFSTNGASLQLNF